MAKMKKPSGVLCLESMWDGKAKGDRLSVRSLLEVLDASAEISFVHLTCNTRSELAYGLRFARRYPTLGILYLAFHGSRGELYLPGEKEAVRLEELAEMAPPLDGWMIHFSGCSTISDGPGVLGCLDATGAALATGYRRQVGWIDGAAMDFVLLATAQEVVLSGALERRVMSRYRTLVESTGLAMVHGGASRQRE